MQKFFTALGSGDQDSVPDAEGGGDDEVRKCYNYTLIVGFSFDLNETVS